MTFDEAIILNDRRKRLLKLMRQSKTGYCLAGCIEIFMAGLIGIHSAWLIMPFFIPTLLYIIWLVWVAMRASIFGERLYRFIEQNDPSWHLRCAALAVDDDYVTAMLSAIECEQSHLAGDCPLCGAE